MLKEQFGCPLVAHCGSRESHSFAARVGCLLLAGTLGPVVALWGSCREALRASRHLVFD